MKRFIEVLALILCLTGCTGLPEGITPVQEFELPRYLGKWYEIARMPHSFEEDLHQVTANYSMRDDGGVKVINRGFNIETKQWSEAEGKAYFVESSDQGYLKVSFFGPFYGSYVIFYLDKEEYQHAYVSGPDREYLWYLARTPTVSKRQLDEFVQTAKDLGFDTQKLIFPEQK